jgi:ASC-1-like (ASCH) protein
MQHDLKVWPEYFAALIDGRKTFEARKNDRGFKVGDTLLLREYAPGPDEYTGRSMVKTITHMVSGDDPIGYAFGVRSGFCVLSIRG